MLFYKSLSKLSFNDKLLYIVCFLIGALVLLRDVGDVSYSKYVLLAVCTIPMFLLNYSNFIGLLSFLFALTFGIPSNFIFIAAVFIILWKGNRVSSQTLLVFVVFSLLTIIDHFVYQGNVSTATFIGYFIRLLLLFVLINEDTDGIDYNRAISLFSIGVVVMCLAILGYYLKSNSIDDMLRFGTRLGDASTYIDEGAEQGMKMNTNANNVACYCICAMGCCMNVFMKNRNPLWAAFFFLVFALGMLTVSRAFIVLGAIVLLSFIFIASRGHLQWYLKLLFTAIVATAIYYFLQSDFVSLFSNRFDTESLAGDTRGSIFSGYWNAFWSDPGSIIIGAGVYSHRDVLYTTQSTHNMLEQILVSYGLPGFIFFVSYLYRTFKKSYKTIVGSRVVKQISLITIVATLAYQQTIQYLAPHDLMLPTIIGMFALNNIKYSELNR